MSYYLIHIGRFQFISQTPVLVHFFIWYVIMPLILSSIFTVTLANRLHYNQEADGL